MQERRLTPRKEDAGGFLEDAAWSLLRAAHKIRDVETLIRLSVQYQRRREKLKREGK